jgi:isopenicillin-N epimerase
MNNAVILEQENALWGADWHSVRQMWSLDFSVFQFSHGAYGACPNVVRTRQHELLDRINTNPTAFFRRDLLPLFDAARVRAAEFCGATPENVAWVRNATDGVTAAINALPLRTGDEFLITNHIYESARMAVERKAKTTGATIVQAHVPLTDSDDELLNSIEAKVTNRTRALIVDDIAAPTARVFPVARIAELTKSRGITLIVDAAHGPGMHPIELERHPGIDMWVGNFHKWICAPYSAGILWAAQEWHDKLQPLSASFRENLTYPQNFGRLGTDDLTGPLCVPDAIDFIETLGLEKVRNYSHKLVAIGAQTITNALNTKRVPGKFAGRHPVALPEGVATTDDAAYALQTRIGRELRAELSVSGPIANEGHGYLLISAFAYNHPDDYQRFAEQLVPWLGAQQ